MIWFHNRNYLKSGESVIVEASHVSRVMLLTDESFADFRAGRRYPYHGGEFARYPAILTVIITGWWNTVVLFDQGIKTPTHTVELMRIGRCPTDEFALTALHRS